MKSKSIALFVAVILFAVSSCAGIPPTLRQGDKGENVRTLQYRLNSKLPGNLVVDGEFGPATFAAVKRFQRQVGITVDGIVGPVTWNRLFNGSPPSAATRPTLRQGAKGNDVRILQARLNRSIGSNLDVDGDFGPATFAAVKQFQRRVGITVDGIVGPITWNRLGL